MILQKLKYDVKGPLELAETYYTIMSTLNGFNLAKREIQLMAITAVNGNIGSDRNKEEFVKVYASSLATVGNIITRLRKTNPPLLVKEGKKVTVNPGLMLDFTKDFTMAITLEHKKDDKVNEK